MTNSFFKSYNVEFFSGEEFGHELAFDAVKIKTDESLVDKAYNFVKSTPGVESVTLDVEYDNVTLLNEGNEIDKEEVPIIFCHIIVNESYTYCRFMLDDNDDVLVECGESEVSL